jgi:hypothetical protein
MPTRFLPFAFAAAVLASCTQPSTPATKDSGGGNEAPPSPPAASAPVAPPAPGSPGGLPDDRGPIEEAPFAETSAQGAANVVQTYYALLEAGRYGEARRLWDGGGEASGTTEGKFESGFAAYRDYHAQIGAPGVIEGAAGSLYVEVPVVLYGRLKQGAPFSRKANVTLRRINDVPGSSADDRRWHIRTIEEAPADPPG